MSGLQYYNLFVVVVTSTRATSFLLGVQPPHVSSGSGGLTFIKQRFFAIVLTDNPLLERMIVLSRPAY